MKYINHGCTRLVFLLGNYAIKIPNFTYSQLHFLNGCYANVSERHHTKIFPDCDKTAPTYFASLFGLVSIQRRCEPLERHLTDEETEYFNTTCSGDIKAQNFGYLNGRLVCLDYP